MSKVCVLGSGGWGTAVSILLYNNGHDVTLWSFDKTECENLEKYHENKPFLPGIKIPEGITFVNDLSVCRGKDLIVIATPSHGVRNVAKSVKVFLPEGQKVLNISKGIEEGTYLTLSEVLSEELPQCQIAVMSGPSHAEEVSRGIPTTNVVASSNVEISREIQDIFMSPNFRVYTSDDVVGVELGGSIKNVIALCCGILDGIGCGDNTKAALMTRGIVEMTRLGVAKGARSETFAGLSGIGDLIVTCTSMHSRNRRAGILIGQGKSVEEAQKEVNMVVEGVRSCKATYELAKSMNVEMPIIEEAYKVLFEGVSPKTAIANLMSRTKKHESETEFLNNI